MPIIAPSLLSCDFLHLNDECTMLNESVADWYHLDVMDGRFVPNITFGLPIIKQIRKATAKTLDVHLMIVEPEKYLADFKDAGANILTIHIEATTHLHRIVQEIKELGIKAGVALNPHTPVSMLEWSIKNIDLVCLMSVNPGFGGQIFIPQTLDKIKSLKQLILREGSHALIEVDGGVTLSNAKEIIAAGADVLVAGNTVFSAANPKEVIALLKNI